MTEHLIDADKVDEIFMTWVNDLVTNHGDKTVAQALTSPAVLSMFTGDVAQSVNDPQDEPEPSAIEVGGVRMEYDKRADAIHDLASAVRFHGIASASKSSLSQEDIDTIKELSK